MQKSMNNNYSKKSDVRFAFCNSEENPITTAHCLNWNDSRIKANTWRHIIFINPQSHITGYFYKRLLVYFTHKNMHGNEYEKVECHIKLNVREWEIDRSIEVLIIRRISGYFTHALLLAMDGGMKWHMES